MKKTILILIYLCSSVYLLSAQTREISGQVIDSEDNSPLMGVNVIIQGAGTGTVTDFDGNYTLSVEPGQKLLFKYIGYKEQSVDPKGRTVLNISLETNSEMLDEVVAIGYGTMKKSDLTGAVASVRGDQLQKTPASGLDQALQGKVAGVTVNANSGQPGQAAEVRIRGIGTALGDAAPIYVVDGAIVTDISFLSPSDIKSTEILKDASSTAIYGSRGANGVILITTKQGTEGKNRISFNSYVGFQNRWKKLDLMESKEFAETIIDLNNVQSEKNYYNTNGFNKWLKAYRLGNSPYYPTDLDYSAIETDWQDEVFQSNALIQNYHLSIDGGNEKNRYAVSSSYFNQDGTIIGSEYERFTIRVNSSFKVRDWLTVGENMSYVSSNSRNAMNNNSSPGASILSAALAMAPWDPTHYPQGSVNNAGKDLSGQIAASSNFRNVVNPFSMVQNSNPEYRIDRFFGDVFLELRPIKNLVVRSDISMDLALHRDKLFKSAYEYSSFDKADKNYLSSAMGRYHTLINENTATYSNKIGKHDFSIMVGQTMEEWNYYNIGGSGSRILNPSKENWYLSQTTDDRTYASDNVDRTRMFSLLGRLHYSYDSRYLATVNFRSDGSSKFPDNPWGYFPSLALAWRISEERFMENVTFLDHMKIRAGWGQIGNQGIDQRSFLMNMFNSGPTFVDYVLGTNQQFANGATVLTYVNKGGKWERTEQWNVGIDAGFFNGLLDATVDMFIRDTKDMIMYTKAPAHVANMHDPVANVGVVRNQGIEVTLNHYNKIGKFNYNIGGNVSFIKNELTDLNGGNPIYGDRTLSDEGLALYTFWGYKYEGVYKTDAEAQEHLYGYDAGANPFKAGDAKFADLNGDGKIDDSDKADIGNPFPWLTYGINIGAQYKGFDLELFFQGVYGNEIYNATRIRTEGKGTEATLSTKMHDVWTAANPNGSIPNPYGNSMNFDDSSRFIESGAYLRLKNIQLGYTLPKEITQKIQIDRLRFYASVSNLFTITDYTGYDPEVTSGVDYGNYPQARTFTIGLNADF